jgi:hypothetical protein
MSGNIRTRDGLPFNFEDGLMVKGKDLAGFDGAKTIGFKAKATDTAPTVLDDWIRSMIVTVDSLRANTGGGNSVPDQLLTDSSNAPASTRFTQTLIASKLSGLTGTTPSTLSTLSQLANAIGNDPNYAVTVSTAMQGKISVVDLQSSPAVYSVAGGLADAVTSTFTPAITTLRSGIRVTVRAITSNKTTATTYSPNPGVVAYKPVVKAGGVPLVPGDISGPGHMLDLQYDSVLDNWELINPATPSILPFATSVEAIAGTSTNTVINPTTLKAVMNAIIGGSPAVLDTLQEFAIAINNDPNFATTMLTALAGKAAINSQVFTGTPSVPTPAIGNNSQIIANTAFVMSAITAAMQSVTVVDASTLVKGVSMFATDIEALAGLINSKTITPSSLKYVLSNMALATSSQQGPTILATDQEAYTGVISTKAVTPKSLKFALDTALSALLGTQTPPVAPTLTGASTVVIGLTYTLTLAASATVSGASVTSFDVSVNNGSVSTILAGNNTGTFTWVSSGTVGTAVTFSATAKDSNGKISSVTTKTITLSTVTINAPLITSPVANSSGVTLTPTLSIGSFSATGGADTWLNTDWEIRTAANGGGSQVWAKSADISNTGSTVVPAAALNLGQVYFFRARVRGATYGASAYSEVQFTTQQAPSVPLLTGASSVVVGQTYTLGMSSAAAEAGATITSFSVSVNGGAASTIAANAGIGTINWTAVGTSGTTASFTATARDSNGNSSASITKSITLASVTINTVTLTAPVNNASNQSIIPTFTTAAFATTGGSDTHANTDWEIRTAASGAGTLIWASPADSTNKTSITIPANTLVPGTGYYVRARHRGTTYGVGGYGESYFTTAPVPGGPVLTGNAGVVANTPYVLSIGATAVAPATYIVSFNIAVDGGAAVNVTASNNAAIYTLPAAYTQSKTTGATVLIEVSAIDNTGVQSSKSSKTITVTTINTPSITSPAANSVNNSVTPTLTSSAFATTGATDLHASTTWEIRTAANGAGTQVWISAANTVNKTSVTVPAGKLSNGVVYYARCLYTGVNYGSSGYSSDVSFTTVVSSGPALTGSATTYVGADYVITMSATPASGTVTSFSVSFNGSSAVVVQASGNSATYTYPGYNSAGKLNGQAGSVSVTYLSSLGSTSSATTLNFSYVMPTVNTPIITSPTAGATGVSLAPILATSNFSITGGTDNHLNSDWLVINSAGAVIYSSPADSTNKTSITIPAGKLSPNTSYTATVAHRSSSYGSSAVSQSVTFTTQAANPGPAVGLSNVTYPNSTIVSRGCISDTDYYFNITQVAPVAPATSIASVQYTVDGGPSMAVTYYNLRGIQYRIVIPVATLSAKSAGAYLNISVTSTDNLGNVSLSTAQSVMIDPIVTPVITSPANGATNVPTVPVFTKSSFATTGGMIDAEVGSYWEIRTAPNGGGALMWNSGTTLVTGNSITCTGADALLQNNTTYYMRVRTYGSVYGASKVSADVAFTTVPAVVFAQIQKLFSPTAAASAAYFGASLACNYTGSVVAIASPNELSAGRGAVVVFNRSGTTYTPIITVNEGVPRATNNYNTYYYGVGMGMDSAGMRFVVGGDTASADITSPGGWCRVFSNASGSWALEATLLVPGLAVGSCVGWSCSMNAAGDTIAVGAPLSSSATIAQQGSVHIFTRSGTTWTLQASKTASDSLAYDWFGHEVSLSDDGNRLLVGSICNDAPLADSGAAYVFTRSGTTWTQVAKLAPADLSSGDYMGAVVSLSGDGNTAVISAHLQSAAGLSQTAQAGAAYVYTTTNGTTWTLQAKLTPSDPVVGGNFGRTVSVSSNGNKLIVGCNHFNNSAGAAYHFTRSGTTWTQKRRFTGSDSVSGDHFGTDGILSPDGNYAVLTAPFATATVYSQGVAYAFAMD